MLLGCALDGKANALGKKQGACLGRQIAWNERSAERLALSVYSLKARFARGPQHGASELIRGLRFENFWSPRCF